MASSGAGLDWDGGVAGWINSPSNPVKGDDVLAKEILLENSPVLATVTGSVQGKSDQCIFVGDKGVAVASPVTVDVLSENGSEEFEAGEIRHSSVGILLDC